MSLYSKTTNAVEKALSLFDRLFNKIYTSEYNPIYRSGTIAVTLLFMATVSGLILIFFYRVGEPYQTLVALEENWWFGKWLRSFHRYSSDGMLIAAVFHVFRMWAQKKSWGPRAFPWITGALLTGVLLFTAWSGFVMIWDAQAQAFLANVVSFLDSTGIFSTPIAMGFDGSSVQPPSSFFFFLVFFHVAAPLGMIFGVWVHTMRLARASWFPKRKLMIALGFLLFVLSLAAPTPLDPEGNLLLQTSGHTLNLWYMFWLPFMKSQPWVVFLTATGAALLIVLLPFLLRPPRKEIPPRSTLDKDICNGCNQCVVDCPYEAISLVDRKEDGAEEKELSKKHAVVDPMLCVSCALCTASCPVFTIGPKGRTSIDQHKNANNFLRTARAKKNGAGGKDKKLGGIVVISCVNQPYNDKKLKALERMDGVNVFPIECMGTLHMRTVGQMSSQAEHIILAACPERNCSNKDAHMLLRERKTGTRLPHLPERADKTKIHLVPTGDGEDKLVENLIKELRGEGKKRRKTPVWAKAFSTSFILLSLLALGSNFPLKGEPAQEGALRLSWKLQSQKLSECREIDEESASSLKHMRMDEECSHVYPDYRLRVAVGGELVFDEQVSHSGRRKRSPLHIYRELKLAPGIYRVDVEFAPEVRGGTKGEGTLASLEKSFEVEIRAGETSLIGLDKTTNRLRIKYYDGQK